MKSLIIACFVIVVALATLIGYACVRVSSLANDDLEKQLELDEQSKALAKSKECK